MAGLTWATVNQALCLGYRGLPGGSSVAKFLYNERGVRGVRGAWQVEVDQILAWADAFHARHGRWPTQRSGRIADAEGMTWACVDQSLYHG